MAGFCGRNSIVGFWFILTRSKWRPTFSLTLAVVSDRFSVFSVELVFLHVSGRIT